MALTAPRVLFGVHSWTPYSRTTGEFYGIVKVLGGSSLALSGELIKLNGGSAKYPWAVETGQISAEMSLKVKEYPDFLFTLFLGLAPTTSGSDTAGAVSTPANYYGTSVVQATTGIATVSVIPSTGAANLKFGKYVIKAASSTTFDLFMSTDVDFLHGTDETYDNDLLRVATAQTVTASTNTDIASLGLRFGGGSGTIGMTTGDTATFEVKPPSSASTSVVIGATTDVFPEFGSIIMGQRQGNGRMVEIDVFRCRGIGLPINFEENAFSEAEIKVEAFYDASNATPGVFKIRDLIPT